jgi:hypothetical protein
MNRGTTYFRRPVTSWTFSPREQRLGKSCYPEISPEASLPYRLHLDRSGRWVANDQSVNAPDRPQIQRQTFLSAISTHQTVGPNHWAGADSWHRYRNPRLPLRGRSAVCLPAIAVSIRQMQATRTHVPTLKQIAISVAIIWRSSSLRSFLHSHFSTTNEDTMSPGSSRIKNPTHSHRPMSDCTRCQVHWQT